MKTTVIYHKADYDGIFCREIARRFLPDAELIGWDFGDTPLDPGLFTLHKEDRVYVLDLPCDKPFGLTFPAGAGPDNATGFSHFVWIDHHASAIASHPKNIPGYRIDGVAACRLAWQWFYLKEAPATIWPDKTGYVRRVMLEPEAVRLVGEFDIWDRRDPNAEVFQYALDSVPSLDWQVMLGDASASYVELLLIGGRAARTCIDKRNADVVRERSFNLRWEGLLFLCLNTARCNSLTFQAAVQPEHDGLLGFYWNGHHWTVSLYGATKPDIDLSAIAVKYGGGGHKQACGFTCPTLPWM